MRALWSKSKTKEPRRVATISPQVIERDLSADATNLEIEIQEKNVLFPHLREELMAKPQHSNRVQDTIFQSPVISPPSEALPPETEQDVKNNPGEAQAPTD
ncbi:hypothetical protein LTR37_021274, partial [Vermiconidia calcicola]